MKSSDRLLVAQRGVMGRRKTRIQPIWMDRFWWDQADHDNYGRRYERAARQDPERDSVNIRPHTTGRDGIEDGHGGKHAQPKCQKSGHALPPCPKYTPTRCPPQYFRSLLDPAQTRGIPLAKTTLALALDNFTFATLSEPR